MQSRIDPACRSNTWSTPIARLIAAGYSFLSNRYTDDGFLFRGMECGVWDAIANGSFGHFEGLREESRVERIMDVFFLTHEIRDALTIADMGDNKRDGGILIIPAAHFNQSLDKKTAAFMAIGDSGMVFHYPFLTEKISLKDVYLLVATETLAIKLIALYPEIKRKLLILPQCVDNEKEEILNRLLLDHGVQRACILPDTVKPQRKDLTTE